MAFVSEQFIFDFSDPGALRGWRPVDDVVMGGRSKSRVEGDAGVLIFSGELSLEQGGGFASIRSPRCDMDISCATALVVIARGDGQSYKVGLRLSPDFDSPVYQASFKPPEENFGEIMIPFPELRPHYHGRLVAKAPPFNPNCVCSIGFLISERQAGPFRMEIRTISCR